MSDTTFREHMDELIKLGEEISNMLEDTLMSIVDIVEELFGILAVQEKKANSYEPWQLYKLGLLPWTRAKSKFLDIPKASFPLQSAPDGHLAPFAFVFPHQAWHSKLRSQGIRLSWLLKIPACYFHCANDIIDIISYLLTNGNHFRNCFCF